MKKFQIALPAPLRPENGALQNGDHSAGSFVTRGHKFNKDDTITDSEDFVTFSKEDGGTIVGVFDGHGGTTCPRAVADLLIPRLAQDYTAVDEKQFGMLLSSSGC